MYNQFDTKRLITEVEMRSIRTYALARSMTRDQLIILLTNNDNRVSQGHF